MRVVVAVVLLVLVVGVGPVRPVGSSVRVVGVTSAGVLVAGGDIHKIEHVVTIMQENRSFDSYFGTYPGADGIPMNAGVPVACLPRSGVAGCVRPYHDHADVNTTGPHGTNNADADIHGGAMDGFEQQAENTTRGCTNPTDPNCRPASAVDVMGYHDNTEIPNYWTYADNFVLQDAMFQPDRGWSLPSHQYLVSGWAAKCASADAMACTSDSWGGQVPPDAQPGPVKTDPTYAWTDVTELLHRAGVSWNYYVTDGTEPDCRNDAALVCAPVQQNAATPGVWNPLPWFTDVQANAQLSNITSTTNFYAAAAAGTLPAVSWVAPSFAVSEHGPARVSDGQAYVTSLINAVMAGPDWSSTAIFVSWDDWGGLYDHVAPPSPDAMGYGLRVPGLVISPYAKTGYIDHQTLSHDAYLKFIEDDFLGGQRLDPATDGRPDPRPSVREYAPGLGDLVNDFDFTQSPRPPMFLPTRPWPAPTITTLSPNGGTTAGGANVTITGTGFTGDTQVFVDSTALPVTVLGPTTLQVAMPGHRSGLASINVTTRGGASAPASYLYTAATTQVAALTPARGNLGGGNTVVIAGSGFTNASAVAFGPLPAVSFHVDSDARITATVPAATAGAVHVKVTSDGPTGPDRPVDLYTYSALPMISSMSTPSGLAAGGTSLTINGGGFTDATSVRFLVGANATSASNFHVDSDTQITAVVPPHAIGTTLVSVTNAAGTSTSAPYANWYTYVVSPVVTSIGPNRGTTAGGTVVTIRGRGFSGATKVQLTAGRVALSASTFHVDSDTQITAVTPARVAGLAIVTVTNPAGTSPTPLFTTWFTYTVPPAVTAVTPATGPSGGGTPITITGTGFTGATAVTLASVPVPFTVVNDRTITATTPPHPPGVNPIIVVTPNGPSTAATSAPFTDSDLSAFTGSVTGSVGDGSAPLEGIGVVIFPVTSLTPYAYALTDVDGTFTIANVAPGRYKAVAVDLNQLRGTPPFYPYQFYDHATIPVNDFAVATPIVVQAGAATPLNPFVLAYN